jgi:hypothetical protein
LTRPRGGATLTEPALWNAVRGRSGSSRPDLVVWTNSEEPMAKALLGHVGGPDPRLVDEIRRLRRRVNDLETEIGRLLAERDLLTETVLEHPLTTVGHPRGAELDDRDAVPAGAVALS